ncbi:carbohydrate-binding domain-containing protein [Cupriavidus basilensis]|uniref:Carbohydrate-binding domain-containing protein n=1 Tax=Cupriavidus basilensis TaxID=68895 RepID=A0ABT6AYR8_9BURK|nr:carbohydrate-binding domain-containing protein [Cupriavidus basilensis]MDF3836846.1 carbohydrate-binding domain-containing protein [Cupriavidus basilensis]
MVAIVTGNGLGLQTGSGYVLGSRGQIGDAGLGRGGERVYVNATTGNLYIQHLDQFLVGRGPDIGLTRTYNSQGQLSDGTGPSWRPGQYRYVSLLFGTIGAAGSTVRRVDWDGSEAVFTWDAARSKYVSTDGAGAYDLLAYDGASKQWTWTDGDTGLVERYDGNNGGRIVSQADVSSNTVGYSYDAAGNLVRVQSASGESVYLDYTGNLLTQVRSEYKDSAGTLVARPTVRYSYDTSSRLSRMGIDLTPEDGVVTDGKEYWTSYTYNGSSQRIASITQSDGSKLEFTYVASGNTYRISTLKQTMDGVARTTSLSYDSATQTTITDALGQKTVLGYDARGRLIQIKTPAVGGVIQTVTYGYDNADNLISIQSQAGSEPAQTITYQYDGNGNLILQRDDAGNTVMRTYDAGNRVLTETTYVVPDPDGAGAQQPSQALTTRYIYDSKERLRFTVSAEGRVNELKYDVYGQVVNTTSYNAGFYAVAGLAATTTLSESQLQTWTDTQPKEQRGVIDNTYDFRGGITSTTKYGALYASGSGYGASGFEVDRINYWYNQEGRLIKRNAYFTDGTKGEVFTYDGLGRMASATDMLGAVTLYQYDDANRKTTVTLANGLVRVSIYSQAGELLAVTESGAGVSAATRKTYYDSLGRIRMTEDETGVRVHTLYDEAGRQIATVDGNGTLVERVYDGLGRQIRTITYAATLTAAQLASLVDAAGKPKLLSGTAMLTLENASIRPTRDTTKDRADYRFYDSANRLIKSVSSAGAVTDYSYDGLSRLVGTTARAKPVDPATLAITPTLTNATVTADAADRTQRSFYDGDGKLTGLLDAEGYLTEYRYDAAGNRTQTIRYSTRTDTTKRVTGTLIELRPNNASSDIRQYAWYDMRGNVIAEVDGEGYLTTYLYDIRGNVARKLEGSRLDPATLTSPQAVPVTFQAKGTVAGGVWPAVEVWVDGVKAGSVTVNSTDFATYTVNVANIVPVGPHRISLVYTNDATIGTEDRNLWVRNGKFGTRTFVDGPEIQYFDAGVGNAAFDGQSLTYTPSPIPAEKQFSASGAITWTLSTQWTAMAFATPGANPRRTDYSYDYNNRLNKETRYLASGTESTDYAYDTVGNRISVKDVSRQLQYRYDARGRMTQELNGEGSVALAALGASPTQAQIDAVWATWATQYAYDAAGRRISSTAPDGRKTFYYYNNDSQLTYVATSAGEVVQYGYSAFGERESTTVFAARVTDQTVLAALVGGLETTAFTSKVIRNASADIVTSVTYDQAGRVKTSTDGRKSVATNTYTAFGELDTRLTPIANGVTALLSNTYDRRGLLVSSIQDKGGLNFIGSTAYDAFGRITQTTDASGAIRSQSYDRAGRIVTVTDALGDVARISYDAFGNVLTRTDRTGKTTTYAYSALERQVTMTTPEGLVTVTRRNAWGQTIDVVDPRGNKTEYSYDANGQLLGTKTASGTLNLTSGSRYDTAGRIAETTDANGNKATYQYDAAGRVLTRTVDPGGLALKTTYEYDTSGRTIRVMDANQVVTETQYDENGQKVLVTVDKGVGTLELKTKFEYDAAGNTLKVTEGFGTVEAKITQYVYDKANRRTLMQVDPAGLNLKTAYAYDKAGNVASMTDANGNQTRYFYNAESRLIYTVDGLGNTIRRDYDDEGRLAGTLAYARQIALTGLTDATPRTEIEARTAPLAADAGNRLTRYAYDGNGRLRYTVDPGNYVTEQRYDAAGNVTQVVRYARPISAPTVGSIDSRTITLTGSSDRLGGAQPSPIDTNKTYIIRARLRQVTGEGSIYIGVGTRDANGKEIVNSTGASFSYTAASNVRLTASMGWQTFEAQITGEYTPAAGVYDAKKFFAGSKSAAPLLLYNYYNNGGEDSSRTVEVDYLELVDAATGQVLNANSNMADGTASWTDYRNAPIKANAADAVLTVAQLQSLLHADGTQDATERRVYDAANRVSYSVDAKGYVTNYTYDGNGNVIKTIRYAKAVSVPADDTRQGKTIALSGNTDRLVGAQPAPIDTSKTYIVRARVRQVTGEGSIYIGVSTRDASGKEIVNSAGGNFSYAAASNVRLTPSMGWQTFEARITGEYTPAAGVYDAKKFFAGSQSAVPLLLYNYGSNGGADSSRTVEVDYLELVDAANGQVLNANGNMEGGATSWTDIQNVPIKANAADTELTAAALQGLLHVDAANDVVERNLYDKASRKVFSVDGMSYVTQITYDGVGRQSKVIRYATTTTVTDSTTTAALQTTLPAAMPPATAAVTETRYDRAGRVFETVDAGAIVTRHMLDALGQATQVIRAYGTTDQTTTARAYDKVGRLLSETRAYGTAAAATTLYRYRFEATGVVKETIDPRGAELVTSDSDWAKAVRSDILKKETTVATLTAADKETLLKAFATITSYDKIGRVSSVKDPLGGETLTEYDAFGNAVKVTDPRRNVGLFYFDALNRNIVQVDPEGYVTQTEYNATGKPVMVRRFASKINGTVTTNVLPEVLAKAPDSPAGRVYVLGNDALDAKTAFQYDKLGRLTLTTDAEGGTEAITYDAFSNKATFKNKLEGVTAYQYDKRGLLIRETLPVKSKNQANVLIDVVNAYEYDARGNRIKTIEALGLGEQRITQFTYNLLDQLTQTQKEAMRTFALDVGWKDNVIPTETRQYDKRGNLTVVTAANGGVTRMYYDAANRKAAELNPAGTLTQFTYDKTGNAITTRTYAEVYGESILGVAPIPSSIAKFREVKYKFDANSRMIESRISGTVSVWRDNLTGSLGVGTGDIVRQWTYDLGGLKIREVDPNRGEIYTFYDKLGRQVLGVDQEGYAIAWARDTNGNVLQETKYARRRDASIQIGPETKPQDLKLESDPINDRVTVYTYDRNGKVSSESKLNVRYTTAQPGLAGTEITGTVKVEFGYDKAGNLTQKTDALGKKTDLQYDMLGRQIRQQLPQMVDVRGFAVRSKTDYEYDGLGNTIRIIRRGENDAAEGDDQIQRFVYGANGLVASEFDALNRERKYGHDASGNTTYVEYTRLDADGAARIEATQLKYDTNNREVARVNAWRLTEATPWTYGDRQEIRYNQFSEMIGRKTGAGGPSGTWQTTYEYDDVGRVWRTNADQGVYRMFMYDASGNATVKMESQANDLSTMTLDTVKAELGNPTGPSLFQVTVTLFDKRNQVIDVIQPDFTKSDRVPGGVTYTNLNIAAGERYGRASVVRGAAVNEPVPLPSLESNAKAPAITGNLVMTGQMTGTVRGGQQLIVNLPELARVYGNYDIYVEVDDEGSMFSALPFPQSRPFKRQSIPGYAYDRPRQAVVNLPAVAEGNLSGFYRYTARVYLQSGGQRTLLGNWSRSWVGSTLSNPDGPEYDAAIRSVEQQTLSEGANRLMLSDAGLSAQNSELRLYARTSSNAVFQDMSNLLRTERGTIVAGLDGLSGEYEFLFVAVSKSSGELQRFTRFNATVARADGEVRIAWRFGDDSASLTANGAFVWVGGGIDIYRLGLSSDASAKVKVSYKLTGSSGAWQSKWLTSASAKDAWRWDLQGLSGNYDVLIEHFDAQDRQLAALTGTLSTGNRTLELKDPVTDPTTVIFKSLPRGKLKVTYRPLTQIGVAPRTIEIDAQGDGRYLWNVVASGVPWGHLYALEYEVVDTSGQVLMRGMDHVNLEFGDIDWSRFPWTDGVEIGDYWVKFTNVPPESPKKADRMQVTVTLPTYTPSFRTVTILADAAGILKWHIDDLQIFETRLDFFQLDFKFYKDGVLLEELEGSYARRAGDDFNVIRLRTYLIPPRTLIREQYGRFDVMFNPAAPAAKRMELRYRLNGKYVEDFAAASLTADAQGKFKFDGMMLRDGEYEFYYDLFDAGGKNLGRHTGYFVRNEDPQSVSYNRDIQWVISIPANGGAIHRRQERNAFGDVISEMDGRGSPGDGGAYTTSMVYNTLGKLIDRIGPESSIYPSNDTPVRLRPTTHYGYDANGNLTLVKDANGNSNWQDWEYGLEKAAVRSELHADGGGRTNLYDILGNRSATTDVVDRNAAGVVTVARRTDYVYDLMGQLKQVLRPVDPNKGYARSIDGYEYDILGNRIAVTNALNFRTRTYYDVDGRVVRTVSADGLATNISYTYDSVIGTVGARSIGGWRRTTQIENETRKLVDDLDIYGRTVKHIDLGGHAFTYQFNNAGLIKSQTGSSGQNILYEYFANGMVRSIEDKATGLLSLFQYDRNGNRIFEGVKSTFNGYAFQQSNTEYDALNRITKITDPRYTIEYWYDAVGNRRRMLSQYYDGTGIRQERQEYWYKYDAMNRFTVTMGQLVNKEIVQGASGDGVALTYNKLGERTSSLKADKGRAEIYGYDVNGSLTTVHTSGKLTSQRENDAAGRVTTYTEWDENSPASVTRKLIRTWSKDNLLMQEHDSKNDRGTNYAYNRDGAIRSAQTYDNVPAKPGESKTTTLTEYSYDYWDTAKQSRIMVTASNPNAPGWKPGLSDFTYDVNGRLKTTVDANSDTDKRRSFTYQVDADGQILQRDELLGGTVDPATRQLIGARSNRWHSYYFFDGKRVGNIGNDGLERVDYALELARREQTEVKSDDRYRRFTPVKAADFDENYQPINSTYPGAVSGTHTVRSGETLGSIASTLWGDASLWYVLAEANGYLSPDVALPAGMMLVVPNKVTNIHNNASTFKVYDAGKAIGDTSPTLPDPPPPPPLPPAAKGGGGCGGIGMVIAIVVAVVATIVTAGAAATAMGATSGIWSAGIAAVTGNIAVLGTAVGWAGAIGSAAIGGAIGSIASQGVMMAAGLQDKFSWKGVALGAVGAGVASGLGVSGLASSLKDLGNAGGAIATGAIRSTVTQGIGVVTGLQRSFDWQGVAASAVAAGVGYGVQQAVGSQLFDNWSGKTAQALMAANPGKAFGIDAFSGLAAGTASAAVRGNLNGNIGNIAIDAISSSVGNRIAEMLAQRSSYTVGNALGASVAGSNSSSSGRTSQDQALAQAQGSAMNFGSVYGNADGPSYLSSTPTTGMFDGLTIASDTRFSTLGSGIAGGASGSEAGGRQRENELARLRLEAGYDRAELQGRSRAEFQVGPVLNVEINGVGIGGADPVRSDLEVAPGFFAQRYGMATTMMTDPSLSLGQRAGALGLATAVAPLMIGEEAVRGMLNIPAHLSEGVQYLDRAAKAQTVGDSFRNADMAAGRFLEAGLNTVGLGSLAKAGAAQLAGPLAEFASRASTINFVGSSGGFSGLRTQAGSVNPAAFVGEVDTIASSSKTITATRLGNRRLPDGDMPWVSYQKHVTGRSYEELWQVNQERVALDGRRAGYTIEAKWTGRNDAAWDASPYNPSHRYYNEGKIVDQATRQIELNAATSGNGVRFAVSNEAAQQRFTTLFQQHFPTQMGDGTLRVWHVPGNGMR